MAKPIRTVIVDDEPLALETLRLHLDAEPDVEIVGEASCAEKATDQIRALQPDVVFLDIEMAEMSGFEVLANAAPAHMPVVVFVTAYDSYAARAFDMHALDYLLKPFTAERFRDTMRLVRNELSQPPEKRRGQSEGLSKRLSQDIPTADDSDGLLRRFVVHLNKRIKLVEVDNVDWIESAANYVKLHAGDQTFLVRMTMAEVERRLDPARFVRIHRSTIVRTNHVQEIEPTWHGDFTVKLRDGRSLKMSRVFRRRLLS